MATIPTVAIKGDGGKVIINASDFDAEKHVLWQERAAKAEEQVVDETPEAAEKPKPKPRRPAKKQ